MVTSRRGREYKFLVKYNIGAIHTFKESLGIQLESSNGVIYGGRED